MSDAPTFYGALAADEREKQTHQLLEDTAVYLRGVSSQALGLYVTMPTGSSLSDHAWALHRHTADVLQWFETRVALLRAPVPTLDACAAPAETTTETDPVTSGADATNPIIH